MVWFARGRALSGGVRVARDLIWFARGGALSDVVRVARNLMRWIFNMVCVRESVERRCAGGAGFNVVDI